MFDRLIYRVDWRIAAPDLGFRLRRHQRLSFDRTAEITSPTTSGMKPMAMQSGAEAGWSADRAAR
jgi:hypothetical protein